MPAPQSGIFADDDSHHHFLEYEIGAEADAGALKAALAAVQNLQAGDLSVVVAFGPDLWRRLAPDAVPARLAPFEAIDADAGHAPATQRDLFVWLRAGDADDVLDAAMAAHEHLGPLGTAALDLPAFIYRDKRDLIGFVDGTANPKDDARFDAALIPDGEVGAGGSYVFSQKWVHDLPAFRALDVAEQERVVGRTKTDDIELEGDAMPDTSHVSRTDVKVDGVAQKIWRRSAPYGNAAEHGLYFLAFACDPGRIQVQLDRMYGVAGDGLHDRLIAFSQAVTGSYWFAPDATTLASL